MPGSSAAGQGSDGEIYFLTKVPDSAQPGHFFGLQRPSFSNPHFSQFHTAIAFSFPKDILDYRFGPNYKQAGFPVKANPLFLNEDPLLYLSVAYLIPGTFNR